MKKLKRIFVVFLCIVILLVQDFNYDIAKAGTDSLSNTTLTSADMLSVSDTVDGPIVVTFSTGGGTISSNTKDVICIRNR